MKNIKQHLATIFICLLAYNSAFAQNSDCDIYKEMAVYLRDSTKYHKKSPIYVWKEKGNMWGVKGIVKSWKEMELIDDNFQAKEEGLTTEWNKFTKFTCKLDNILPIKKYTKKPKDWVSNEGQLVYFSEVVYDKAEQQAICVVIWRFFGGDVRIYYYFSFEKINGKWTIIKVKDEFRV